MTTIQAHKPSIRHAALCLWADAVWSDDAMKAFSDLHGVIGAQEAFGREITKWPLPPMEDEYVADIAEILEKTETAWGRSLSEIAEEIGEDIDDLCYSICMQSCGHGVGPNDYPNWPDSLDCRKIPRKENPAYFYIADPEDWAKLCVIEGQDVRSYSASWGAGIGTGPMFYNYASGSLTPAEYDAFLDAIDEVIEIQKVWKGTDSEREYIAHGDNLRKLYNHVLWERINRLGRVTDDQFVEKKV